MIIREEDLEDKSSGVGCVDVMVGSWHLEMVGVGSFALLCSLL